MIIYKPSPFAGQIWPNQCANWIVGKLEALLGQYIHGSSEPEKSQIPQIVPELLKAFAYKGKWPDRLKL